MLKVTKLLLLAAAALGMPHAIAQPSPGSSQSGWSYYNLPNGTTRVYAGGSPIGGFSANPSGNTTRFTYQPLPSSPPPVAPSSPSAGPYTTIKRMGDGFTLEQRTNVPVPGRNQSHPVSLQKTIPKASMARAFAKTIPIVGNALAIYELLDEAFSEPIRYNPAENRYEYQLPGSCVPATSSAAWCEASFGYLYQSPPSGTLVIISSSETSCQYRHRCNGLDKTGQPLQLESPQFSVGSTPPGWHPITEQLAENKINMLPQWPNLVPDLLPSVPEQVRRDISNEAAQSSTPVVTRLLSPSGSEVTSWNSSSSTSTTQTVDASGRPVTNITTTTTTATVTGDTITYNTTNITNTTTVTGTDPVTGQPITVTTTSTTTSEQTPNTPQPGEDLECGLPGTPPCKIDETGTPDTDQANFDEANQEIENFKSGLLAKIQEKLDEITHEWTWTFALPTGCAALNFDTKVGPVVQIDMCEHQPMIHDIMSMIWAAAGVFGAMMIFLRSNG